MERSGGWRLSQRARSTRLSLSALLLLCVVWLAGCGGSGSGSSDPPGGQLAGNWQFTMQAPPDGSYVGGIQGGFLLQNGGNITGAAVFSVALPQPPPTPAVVCSSGSATITGTASGQNVTITAVAGNQTFTFTGTLGSNNASLSGSYSSTAGTGADGSPCGSVQSGLSWSATLVPSLTGTFQGNFHSTEGASGLRNQDFAVSGTLTQGANVGASSATVTGTLVFQDPVSLLNDYPCLTQASVNGQISGNTVTLQVFAGNGLNVGQIGGNITPGTPVTFDSTQGAYVLHNAGATGVGYAVVGTSGCPDAGGTLLNPADGGNLCLAFGTSTACTQPLTITPFALTFPTQLLESTPTSQTITLTNTAPSGATLSGLSLSFLESDSSLFYASGGDFNGVSSFVESDSCASPFGSAFSLTAQQSCTITIAYSPQESCPWIPFGSLPNGDAPIKCPGALKAALTIRNPESADQDLSFTVSIKGAAQSAIAASPAELDYGAEAVGESSDPQTITFINQGVNPVQILSAAGAACTYSTKGRLLPRPLINDGAVAGIQVARTDALGATIYANQSPSTVGYYCDADSQSGQPNFPISLNTCLGRLLEPQQNCTLEVTFVPQPATNLSGTGGTGLDYFVELNSLQCTSPSSQDCEIDSGRFPVELKTNPPSPLRMSPAASLDFGAQAKGTNSNPLNLTLFNDPADPNAGTVNFSGKLVQGDYTETDTCPFSLAPGTSCTLSVVFTPRVTGSDPGSITLTYNNGQIQTIYLRGSGK